MKKLTNFLKLLLLNMISIGEQKVWFSGALLQLFFADFGSMSFSQGHITRLIP